MADYMSIEEIEKECANENITANQLDVLVSKTRELTSIKEQEVKKLNELHAQLQERLETASE